jgi:hypothetical protein
MEIDEIERQRHFLQLASVHGEDFKSRVTQHDRENSFPFENVAAMKASGYNEHDIAVGVEWRRRLSTRLCTGARTIGPRRRTHGGSREYASARCWTLR